MDKTAELQNKLGILLQKYHKNKTMLSREELMGKYRTPFLKLQNEIKALLSDYLKHYVVQGIEVYDDEHLSEFADALNAIIGNTDIGNRAAKAALDNNDLKKVEELAMELRTQIYCDAYIPFMEKYYWKEARNLR